jgi:crotonobetainyl-CoA hydratase
MGFVNEVVGPGQALAAARRWAEAILECSPVSVRTTKTVALQGLAHASLEAALAARYDAIGDLVRSADFVEGPRAFAEKRKPVWKGR